jgi:serine/threonine protein kinase
MNVTVDDFWSLLIASQMVSALSAPDLQSRFDESQGGMPATTLSLAQWLIAENLLSRYQAKILLAGRPGPFVYGDYTVYDRHTEGRLQGTFRANHPGTKHRVLLYFHAGPAVENPAIWQTLVDQMAIYTKAVHPHLVRIYQLYDIGQFKFSVLDDLEGESAAERVIRGPVAPAVGCRFVRQVAMGLTKLMELRQAHGVIRPSNIWIDKQGNAQLMLPPLARDPLAFPKFTERSLKEPSEELLKQADYFAPELFQPGARPTTQTEVYALGCTLFQLITGEPPFPGEKLSDKIAGHTSQPVPTLDISTAPSPISQILAAALAKDPKRRLQRPDQLADLLRQALERIDLSQLKWPASRPPSRLPEFESWLSPYGVKPTAYTRVNIDGFFNADKRPLPPEESDDDSNLPVGSAPRALQTAKPSPSAKPAAKPVREVEPKIDTLPGDSPLDWVSGPRSSNGPRNQDRNNRAMLLTIPLVILCIAAGVVAWLVFNKNSNATSVSSESKIEQPVAPTDTATPPEEKTAKPAPNGKQDEHKGSVLPHSVDAGRAPNSEEMVAVSDRQSDSSGDSSADDEPKTIANDGEPMWQSPTDGKPLALAHLAPAVRAILACRPAELLQNPEGAKVLASLGPDADRELKRFETIAGVPFSNVEQLTIAWSTPLAPTAKASIAPLYVLKFAQPLDPAATAAKWEGMPITEGSEQLYSLPDGYAAYFPTAEKGAVLVVGPSEQVHEAAKLEGSPTLLPRDAEALVRSTDDQRMFTLVLLAGAPDANASQSEWLSSLGPIQSFLGGENRAIAISGHIKGDDFFLEVLPRNSLDAPPALVAKHVHDSLQKLSDGIEEYVASLNLQPYGRRVLLRLPQMLKVADEFTRSGAIGDQAILRCYLPAAAAHNLVLGTELALSERLGTEPTSIAVAAATAPKPAANVSERLKQVTSLTFARDTLEKAIQLLADDIGIKAEILGPDLQLEGITKNQSFGLEEKQKPADEILRDIMVKANPDGKLVYVVKPKEPGGEEWVFITTRAAAAKRGDKLPAELATAPPAGKKK